MQTGQSFMRFLLTACFSLGFLLVSAHSQGADSDLKTVRIWSAPDSTRVVFDVSERVRYRLESLDNPFRVVVDIEDISAPARLTQPTPQDKFLQRLRSAPHQQHLRVVLDLKKFARVKSFQLTPNQRYGHRLVIDLYGEEEEEAAPARLIADEVPTAALRDVIIAIDAGHGGEDPGARGPKGSWEKDIVLQLARRLDKKINRERGMRAVLIREGDYYLSLKKRIKLARKYRADLFMSIHADAFKDSRVKGSSVYVLSTRGASSVHARWLAQRENASDLIGGVKLDDKDDMLASVLLDLSQSASLEASIDVAEKVLSGLKSVGKLHKRRVESAGFAVLKSPDIPSILIEAAFISNPQEERKLLSKTHQDKLTTAIVSGLRSYFYTSAPEGTLLAARQHIARQHVITRGDTLSDIATQYRVSIARLKQINQIRGDRIRIGQVLRIPSSSGG